MTCLLSFGARSACKEGDVHASTQLIRLLGHRAQSSLGKLKKKNGEARECREAGQERRQKKKDLSRTPENVRCQVVGRPQQVGSCVRRDAVAGSTSLSTQETREGGNVGESSQSQKTRK